MSDRTAIEWADASWNPLRASAPLGRHFCLRTSPGCDHCYASALTYRYGGQVYGAVDSATIDRAKQLILDGALSIDEKALAQPRHWKAPRRIFPCSMTDLFGEWVPFEWIDQVFNVMLDSPRHTFLVLTKRPTRMIEYWESRRHLFTWPDHIMAGTTIESDAYSWRANVLRGLPARRWVSAEPLLSDLPSLSLAGIAWLVVGGESGPGYRQFDPDWARSLRDRCGNAGTALFFKQVGGRTPKAGGRLLDGVEWSQFPDGRGGIVEAVSA